MIGPRPLYVNIGKATTNLEYLHHHNHRHCFYHHDHHYHDHHMTVIIIIFITFIIIIIIITTFIIIIIREAGWIALTLFSMCSVIINSRSTTLLSSRALLFLVSWHSPAHLTTELISLYCVLPIPIPSLLFFCLCSTFFSVFISVFAP